MMKNLLALPALALAFAMPAQAKTPVKTQEQILNDHVKYVNEGNAAALVADYADDAVTVTQEGAQVGKAAIEASYAGLFKSEGPKMVITPTSIKTEGNVSVVKYTTNIGVSGTEVFVVRNGKIVVDAAYFDPPAAAEK